jgi:hypothetical protein
MRVIFSGGVIKKWGFEYLYEVNQSHCPTITCTLHFPGKSIRVLLDLLDKSAVPAFIALKLQC